MKAMGIRQATQVHRFGEECEKKSLKFISVIFNYLLDSVFLFKKRKGEIVAGATTFFLMLSFCPAILLLISMMGYFVGNQELAINTVMSSISILFPDMAPMLIEALRELIVSNLGEFSVTSFFQILFLGYSALAISSSLMFGIYTVSKVDPDRGFFYEDIKSLFAGLFLTFFILTFIGLSEQKIRALIFARFFIVENSIYFKLLSSEFLTIIYAFLFFSVFYKWLTPIKVKYKNSSLGAIVFISCVCAGKTFYWIYLYFFGKNLNIEYGGFYSYIIIIFWIYYLICSFFYGACVAYISSIKLFDESDESNLKESSRKGKKKNFKNSIKKVSSICCNILRTV